LYNKYPAAGIGGAKNH